MISDSNFYSFIIILFDFRQHLKKPGFTWLNSSKKMFQKVKQQILSFWTPLEDPYPRSQSSESRIRKRRRLNDEDDDCFITHTVKRPRKNEEPVGFISKISSIYQMVIGKQKPRQRKQKLRMTPEKSQFVIVEDESDRSKPTFMTPSSEARHQSSVLKRTGLRQISNSAVLDLTQEIDDNDDDNNFQIQEEGEIDPDLQLTSVKYDLTTKQKNSANRSFTATSKNSSDRKVQTLPRVSVINENYRLEEKERYKDLLAVYTDVILPEYSESLSPGKNESPQFDDASVDLTILEKNTTPLFYQKSFQKPFDVDLTRSELSFTTTNQESSKKFVDLTSVEEPPDVEIVEIRDQSPLFVKNKELMSTSLQSDAILNCEWIQRWRDVIDPVQLERERQIKAEERKVEFMKKKRLEEIEKLSQDNEFPALSNDALGIVKKSLSSGNPKEKLVEGFNAEITRGDISTLRESVWLNDEVVNFYFNLIKSRSESDSNLPKVHVFNTFFYPKIMKTGHAGVKRWTRKVDIFSMDVILIPVHLGMHWCLAVIDLKNKQIVYYDSLKGNNPSCIQGLKKYLADESMDKKKKPFDFTGWKDSMPKDIPEQMNGCDCGVFMSKYAEYKSRFAKFTFTQENMPYFRKRMIYEILSKKLM